MKKLLALILYALVIGGLGYGVAQNINRSVQLSQSPLGPIGADNLGTVYMPLHLNVSGSPPTIGTSLGSGATVVGSDIAGTIALGTGTSTGGTLNWRTAYTSTPFCVISTTGTSPPGIYATPSGATITHQIVNPSGTLLSYICFGRSTG